MLFLKIAPNDPRRAGQLASHKTTFGEFNRFAFAAVHTRFDAVKFFVWDAGGEIDDLGLLPVIRQFDDIANVIAFMAEAQS